MKNIKHKKAIAVSCIALAAVATAGIGYASWVITGTTEATTGTVTVKADDVQDSRLTISNVNLTDGQIIFGPVQDSTGSITSTENKEDMSLAFTFDMTVGEGINGSVSLSESGLNVQDELIVNPLATEATIINIDGGSASVAGTHSTNTDPVYVQLGDKTEQNVYTVTVTLTFKWGTYFNSHNPAEGSEEYITGDITLDQVKEKLQTIYSYNEKNMTITITPTISTGSSN